MIYYASRAGVGRRMAPARGTGARRSRRAAAGGRCRRCAALVHCGLHCGLHDHEHWPLRHDELTATDTRPCVRVCVLSRGAGGGELTSRRVCGPALCRSFEVPSSSRRSAQVKTTYSFTHTASQGIVDSELKTQTTDSEFRWSAACLSPGLGARYPPISPSPIMLHVTIHATGPVMLGLLARRVRCWILASLAEHHTRARSLRGSSPRARRRARSPSRLRSPGG